MITSVEVPDAEPTSDKPASSEGNRGTTRKWFRTMMTKHGHDRAPCQMPSVVPSQAGIPSQTKAVPQKEKVSTMAPGKQQAVSVPSSIDTGHGHLTTRLSRRFTVVDQRLVHASYLFMNTIAYCASQEKKLPKTTRCSEAGSSNVPDEMKPEPSGAQNNVEVGVLLVLGS